MLRSVTGRLVVAFALVLALVLAGLALYIGQAERASILAALDDNLSTASVLLARDVPAAALKAQDRRALDAWADRMGGALKRRVTVIAPDGTVLGDSEVPRDSLAALQNHGSRPEVRGARAQGVGRDVRTSASVGIEYMYVARALPAPRGAVVRVALPVAEARSHVRRALTLLWALAALALVLGAGLAQWRTRPLSRRLRALEDVARRIEGGDLTARASEEGRDEITEVARAVNRVTGGLEATLARVEAERDMREEMLTAMTDGVVLLDRQGHVVHANAALSRALGKLAAGRAWASASRSGAGCPNSTPFSPKRAAARTAAPRGHRLRGTGRARARRRGERLADGSTLLVVRDLTPIRRLERVRRDFVANVSHELRRR